MNKISDEEINKYLNNKYNTLVEEYGENHILGIFIYGKVLYGFAESVDDIKTAACYIPSKDELYFSKPERKEFYKDGKLIDVITDIRLIYDLIKDQDLLTMESLYSNYKIINKKYENIIKKLCLNKEILYHINPYKRVNNAITRATNEIDNYTANKNVDSMFEACRIRIACDLYLEGVSVENCINIKKDYHIQYLSNILNNNFVPDKEEILNSLKEIKEKSKETPCNYEILKTVKKNIIEIIEKFNYEKNNQDIKLSATEQLAFDFIKQELVDNEGYISISKIIEKSKISRPVYTSLLNKLKNCGIAQIDNKGVKGTYITLN